MEVEKRLTTLIEQSLELETIELDLFRSKSLWKPTGARGVFGGQIIAQSLAAATKTVESNYKIHSLHSYFLLAGDSTTPIVYKVYKIRDGKSFCTRSVSAKQKGKTIFIMSCSFQTDENSVLEHQNVMPDVPPPENVKTDKEIFKQWLDNSEEHKIPKTYQDYLQIRIQEILPIEFKPIKESVPRDLIKPSKSNPKQYVWLRAQGRLPDDLAFHHCVAAYASDHFLLGTAQLPHVRLSMMATLDHMIWFHKPFRADEWLLFEMESTRSNSGRGLTFGRMFTRDGTLVLSCAQEGVMRAKTMTRKNKTESKL
ncbi:Acyl-CoA thioesterase 8 [Clydaea vesicula]|uniref:Acyl-CoA thioesterase 8 n=1 Tax=Clydaea vesicula TaxID=447962 RepID=A0AAD5TYX4_9FUNG|nr:Acyl-CoA thioesterase 8 [Clydaea vesicula]KAJ3391614.1 Acyl-CoA thioesterase 8 [Lobulomyces angularis]